MSREDLIAHIFSRASFLCVGLDIDPLRLPACLKDTDDPYWEFNKRIIDATRNFCVAYKPNLAFYEAMGIKGWELFDKTIRYIGNSHLIIADAKRGDIGNTSTQYARTFFETFPCDAVTVAPYMGEDSVTPFLQFPGKWAILLALTSNGGSADFQLTEQEPGQGKLYEKVIRRGMEWAGPDQLMFVIGATHPGLIRDIRLLAPDYFFLVPGVGAQGGDLKSIAKAGMNPDCGLLVNASRSILYAGNGSDFAEKAMSEAARMQEEMAILLKEV